MKGKKWLVLVIGLGVVLLSSSIGVTRSSFVDLESSSGNTLQAWTSTKWVQTSEADFEAGVLNNVDTSSSAGDVKLGRVSEEPTTSVGSEESWWDTSWSRRAPVTINNPGSSLTDYQVKVDVTYDADMQPDFDDIRFVDSDDSTELSHWRESYTASTSATFWVKVPSIPSGAKTIYMYYGNATASSASNGNATFVFFDDFEEHAVGTDPDGWTDQGTENFYVALHDSEKWFQVDTWNDWRDGSTASSMANIGDAVWSAKVYYHQEGTNAWGGIGVHIGNGNIGRIVVIRDGGWYRANEPDWSSGSGWQSNADIHFPLGTKGRIELVTNGTNLDAYWYNPSGYSPEKVTVFTGFTIPSGTGKLDVHIERPGSGNTRWVDADDIIVRKYVSPEPTTSVGAEDGWSRRAPVTINNSGSDLIDYQVKVDVTYDADMQPDFDDIRFVDSDDSTPLSHWRESYTASTSAIFWVKVPSIPSGSKTTYMYYGNDAASSASDGNATFVFFDDFEEHAVGEIPDGWTMYPGCSGVVVQDDVGNKVLDDGTGSGGNVIAGDPSWTDIACRQKFRSVDDVVSHAGVVIRYTDEGNEVYGGIVSDTTAEIWNRIGGTWTQIGGPWTIPDVGTSWHVQELRIAGDTVELYIDDEYIGGGTLTSGAPTSGASGFWCQYSHQGYWDEHFVRKYAPCRTYVSSGTIASQVLDTGVTGARWDALFWDETLQTSTDITFEVRASDTLTAGFPDASWVSVGGTSPVTSGLPSGQYKQWRATLTTSDTSKTPTLHEVRVYHY